MKSRYRRNVDLRRKAETKRTQRRVLLHIRLPLSTRPDIVPPLRLASITKQEKDPLSHSYRRIDAEYPTLPFEHDSRSQSFSIPVTRDRAVQYSDFVLKHLVVHERDRLAVDLTHGSIGAECIFVGAHQRFPWEVFAGWLDAWEDLRGGFTRLLPYPRYVTAVRHRLQERIIASETHSSDSVEASKNDAKSEMMRSVFVGFHEFVFGSGSDDVHCGGDGHGKEGESQWSGHSESNEEEVEDKDGHVTKEQRQERGEGGKMIDFVGEKIDGSIQVAVERMGNVLEESRQREERLRAQLEEEYRIAESRYEKDLKEFRRISAVLGLNEDTVFPLLLISVIMGSAELRRCCILFMSCAYDAFSTREEWNVPSLQDVFEEFQQTCPYKDASAIRSPDGVVVHGTAASPHSFSSTSEKLKATKSFSDDDDDDDDGKGGKGGKEGIEDLHLPSLAGDLLSSIKKKRSENASVFQRVSTDDMETEMRAMHDGHDAYDGEEETEIDGVETSSLAGKKEMEQRLEELGEDGTFGVEEEEEEYDGHASTSSASFMAEMERKRIASKSKSGIEVAMFDGDVPLELVRAAQRYASERARQQEDLGEKDEMRRNGFDELQSYDDDDDDDVIENDGKNVISMNVLNEFIRSEDMEQKDKEGALSSSYGSKSVAGGSESGSRRAQRYAPASASGSDASMLVPEISEIEKKILNLLTDTEKDLFSVLYSKPKMSISSMPTEDDTEGDEGEEEAEEEAEEGDVDVDGVNEKDEMVDHDDDSDDNDDTGENDVDGDDEMEIAWMKWSEDIASLFHEMESSVAPKIPESQGLTLSTALNAEDIRSIVSERSRRVSRDRGNAFPWSEPTGNGKDRQATPLGTPFVELLDVYEVAPRLSPVSMNTFESFSKKRSGARDIVSDDDADADDDDDDDDADDDNDNGGHATGVDANVSVEQAFECYFALRDKERSIPSASLLHIEHTFLNETEYLQRHRRNRQCVRQLQTGLQWIGSKGDVSIIAEVVDALLFNNVRSTILRVCSLALEVMRRIMSSRHVIDILKLLSILNALPMMKDSLLARSFDAWILFWDARWRAKRVHDRINAAISYVANEEDIFAVVDVLDQVCPSSSSIVGSGMHLHVGLDSGEGMESAQEDDCMSVQTESSPFGRSELGRDSFIRTAPQFDGQTFAEEWNLVNILLDLCSTSDLEKRRLMIEDASFPERLLETPFVKKSLGMDETDVDDVDVDDVDVDDVDVDDVDDVDGVDDAEEEIGGSDIDDVDGDDAGIDDDGIGDDDNGDEKHQPLGDGTFDGHEDDVVDEDESDREDDEYNEIGDDDGKGQQFEVGTVDSDSFNDGSLGHECDVVDDENYENDENDETGSDLDGRIEVDDFPVESKSGDEENMEKRTVIRGENGEHSDSPPLSEQDGSIDGDEVGAVVNGEFDTVEDDFSGHEGFAEFDPQSSADVDTDVDMSNVVVVGDDMDDEDGASFVKEEESVFPSEERKQEGAVNGEAMDQEVDWDLCGDDDGTFRLGGKMESGIADATEESKVLDIHGNGNGGVYSFTEKEPKKKTFVEGKECKPDGDAEEKGSGEETVYRSGPENPPSVSAAGFSFFSDFIM